MIQEIPSGVNLPLMRATRIACIIIATERRRAQTWSRVVMSAVDQGFDDIVVVGDWAATSPLPDSVRYFCVEPLTRSTTDALVKRDVGTLATDADVLVYLCDDHKLHVGFIKALRAVLDEPWDVIVPNRFTFHNGTRITLNNGERERYCSGHAGVFRRYVVEAKPWSTYAHHRNWDALISAEQLKQGARFVWSPRDALSIIDLEPENLPWL